MLDKLLLQITNSQTNPLTRAIAIQEILDSDLFTKNELAKKIQKSPSYISNYLRLIKLPEVIKDALLSNIISEGHARSISFLKERDDMIGVFQDIIRYTYSVRRTEQEVNKLRTEKRNYGKVADDLKTCSNRIEKAIGVHTTVVRHAQQIKLVLSFPLGVLAHRKIKSLAELLEKNR